jgi:hypothetical protein
MMNVVSEAPPDSAECLCAACREKALLYENPGLAWAFELGRQLVSLQNQTPDSLGYSLGHHDRAEEIAVAIELKAFGRCGREVVAWHYALVLDLEVPVKSGLNGGV